MNVLVHALKHQIATYEQLRGAYNKQAFYYSEHGLHAHSEFCKGQIFVLQFVINDLLDIVQQIETAHVE